MAKRNVAFIKPEEPDFLKRMKEQIGYKEGPTVDTKRQRVQNLDDSDEDDEREERDDEKPQVVVVKDGDLTAEEAARAQKEEEEKPADLNQKIVFKSKKSKSAVGSLDDVQLLDRKAKKKRDKAAKSKLSFGDDEEEEEEDGDD